MGADMARRVHGGIDAGMYGKRFVVMNSSPDGSLFR